MGHPAYAARRARGTAFVCNVPRLANALDYDRFENDRRFGLVLAAAGDEGDFGDDLLALDNLAEDGVVAGEPRRCGDGDEELAAIGSGAGVGHGQLAGLVEFVG